MAKYLLDTNICISLLKNKYGIREKILDVSFEKCYVSEVTIAELYYGAAKSNRPEHFDDVDNIRGMFKILPIYPSLKLYGELKAGLEQKGQRLDDFDLLIGVTSMVNKMIMVTSNTRHFERIPGIKLEDWAK